MNPPPVYISGSTALQPLIKVVGKYTANATTNPHTLVYLVKDGSCGGVQRIAGDELLKQNLAYIPANYDGTSDPPTCTVDATTGVKTSVVLSDVDATLCPTAVTVPADVKDFSGPVNNMVLVVPNDSSQKAISAEATYLIFGLGASGEVSPWLDPQYYFVRPNDSGTRAMIAANAYLGSGPSAFKWWGQWQIKDANGNVTGNFGSGDVFKAVSTQTGANVDKTIGILGEDYLDLGQNRASVKAIAFRAHNQRYAYWPDSTQSAKDRKNVREGRYPIWGYVHILAKVDGSGQPLYPEAKYFLDLINGAISFPTLTGAKPTDPKDIDDAVTDAHLTPVCAMKVTHSIEGGAQSKYEPEKPCGCSFEARATGNASPAGCTVCTDNTPCGSGVCRKGYCEAK